MKNCEERITLKHDKNHDRMNKVIEKMIKDFGNLTNED